MADESREIRKNRAIRRLRWLVLVAMLGAVAAVVYLLVLHREEEAPVPVEEEAEEAAMEPSGDLVTVGEGFERTFSEGDRELFTIRGERYGVDRDNVVYLEGVEVTIHREDGSQYRIEAKTARFDLDEREGRLEGDVQVVAPDGMELSAPHLAISRNGKRIRCDKPVSFRLGDAYHGTADGLEALLGPRRFVLLGVVTIKSLPGAPDPLRLDTQGLVLDRTRNLIHTRNKAVLRRRGERISALTMDVFLADDEATVRFVRAVDKVQGFVRTGPGGSLDALGDEADADGDPGAGIRRLAFRAERMTMLFTEDGRFPEKAELERGPRGRATIRTGGPPASTHYRLSAPVITAWFLDGKPEHAEATDGVVLWMNEPQAAEEEEAADEASGDAEEAAALEPGERRATAEAAEARFDPEGELTEVVLERDVMLSSERFEATGDQGVFRVGDETGELTGRPAVAVSDRGRMEAPRILYARDAGLVHGTGGVRTRLDPAESSALSGSPLGGGDGPVWVEAEEGFLRDEPREFLFTGDVRAWRGENLLVAEELHGDEGGDRLTAKGSVRTLWKPEDEETPDGQQPQAPLEVGANQLVYRGPAHSLVYTGDVLAEQEKRVLACSEMVVDLAEGGGMDRLVCTGAVRVEDPEQGRSLTGERAVYDPHARTVDVQAAEGGKVSMKDRDGNVVEGPRMKYDIDSGRVQVLGPGSESPSASPAPVEAVAEPVPGEPGRPSGEASP